MLQQRLVAINFLIKCCTRNGQLKEGLQLFQQVFQEGLAPDKVTFLSIISAINGQVRSEGAKWIHTYIIASRYESDVMVGTSLIHMYGMNHNIKHARSMFETMPEKNVVTWNALITALAHSKQNEAVLLFFAQMESEGILPTRITYILIVNVYTSMRDLAQGKRLHARMLAAGYASDMVVECALVTFYGKCGTLCEAESVFYQILVPNVVAWTAMITVYTEAGNSEEAFRCFSKMQGQEVVPNEVTFISLVDVCARQSALQMGMHFHALILLFGFDLAVRTNNALIHFYGKCGRANECWTTFNQMQEKDVISWNGMISACASNDQSSEAMMLFLRLCESGVIPTKATFVGLFEAYAALGMLLEGYALHIHILDASTESDSQLVNALISLYGSCGSLADAQVMFVKASKSNTVVWNAMLGAYVHHGKGDDALTLFRQMLVEGFLPNNVTMIMVFSACACHDWLLDEGRHLHACWVVGSEDLSDTIVYNALLNMYAKCGSSSEVHKTFSLMSKHSTISFNVLMLVSAGLNQPKNVFQLFNEMLSQGLTPDEGSFVSIVTTCASEGILAEIKRMHVRTLSWNHFRHNSVLQNALIDAYGKCKSMEGAWKVFGELLEQDVVAWNILIAACTESSVAPLLFNHMLQQGVMPDEVTYVSMASSCASQATFALASHVHARIVGDPQAFSNVVLRTALVKMHGSCGQVKNAIITFMAMPKRNLISWNTVLRVFACCGKGKDTLELLQQMQREDVTPDKITFVAILFACNHEGLVAEAINLLSVIQLHFVSDLSEDHYSCMVDGLGRAGQLDGAEALLRTMSLQVPCVTAMAFLSSCKTHADAERGRMICQWILEQEPRAAEGPLEVTSFFDVVCVDDENANHDESPQIYSLYVG